ncbi:MAG: geranylgeranylglyceryl/heptaprenylglyceryl phosphate synthase [Cytophagales bacterium]|nr:MAG: geranylgeranylglyceryl/heptaprenylglyceryl phosphate synthase [Cytophagales bacterium]
MQKAINQNAIYNTLVKIKENSGKSLAILIDPDKIDTTQGTKLSDYCKENAPDFFLVGGSLITTNQTDTIIDSIRNSPYTAHIPVLLFPNSYLHLSEKADGILFLSLISGRNPEYLIGNHVIAAPLLKQSKLEVIPTGYILVNCGNQTTVAYISNTTPIPYNKNDIAVCTALAGEMLGLKMIYMDGGSGAKQAISPEMIRAVKQQLDVPLMIGGGIRTVEAMEMAFEAGADTVVIGSAVEQNPELLANFCEAMKKYKN